MDTERWRVIEEHFDAALALPPDQRAVYVARVSQGDPELRAELESLLRASESAGTFLEQPAPVPNALSTAPDIEAGSQLGPWRIVRLIGCGGMGEVYEAERADGQFELRAALKVTRREAAKLQDRFNAERQILARLDHPGIARLLDGGVTPDGRPYAVMDFVEGQTLTTYCDAKRAGLHERLSLFLQVCDAVAHAHGHLIVHRDIKPGNVLVGRDGRARLLDFGIAKPLDADVWAAGAGEATASLLTPDYAAPEQILGEPVTTATDVYALGVLLFELLVGRRPWLIAGHPLAQVLGTLDKTAPRASVTAAEIAESRVPPRVLRGDLDAIIAKCLRREPQHRYPTVNALKLDVERAMNGDAVLARGDERLYVFGRFMRRYRWAAAAVVTIIALLTVGIAGTAWQANRATREAARAAATRDFLISVFRESDQRIARDRRPGEITAKELLDISVERIEKEFAADPQTQLALLEVASEIYGHWGDEPRFVDLLAKRTALARSHFGETHPAVIESRLIDAWGSIYGQNYPEALRILEEADRLIKAGGHEQSALRGRWWTARAEALKNSDADARIEALDRAVEHFARFAPEDSYYPVALANSAITHFNREDFLAAKERNEKAIAVFMSSEDRNDGDVAMTYANLARTLENLGDYAAAERAYEQFDTLIRRTYGVNHGSYWHGAADHARLVHMRGERERAHRMFEAILAAIPADWKLTTEDTIAREYYAERLAAEGRALEAIPLLEQAERTYIERPLREHDLRRVRQTLGDAYDRVGRTEDARRALGAAREERMKKDGRASVAVLGVRERWARFLLAHGETSAALSELREIVRLGEKRPIFPLALAHADLAQEAIARRDAAGALAESRKAVELFDRLTGFYDVRIGPRIWRVHAEALALSGDLKGASEWNARANDASRKYDDPSRLSAAQ